jgi:RNA polymerase sigma-70 factor (ECF subfamily)
LTAIDDSPVIALNRAVAIAQVHGPGAGMEAVTAIQDRQSLESYYLLHAVLGEFETQLNHPEIAANHFRKSLELIQIKAEAEFLSKRLLACEEQIHA